MNEKQNINMKKYTHYLMILFFAFLLISIEGVAQKEAKNNGTLLWHNQQRVLNYFLRGEGFINVNGKNRFTRAIYGTNTGFRFETSDLSPPWKFDITPFAKSGENKIEVMIYNTLANNYTTVPTRYRGAIKSGLIGPVNLKIMSTQ